MFFKKYFKKMHFYEDCEEEKEKKKVLSSLLEVEYCKSTKQVDLGDGDSSMKIQAIDYNQLFVKLIYCKTNF